MITHILSRTSPFVEMVFWRRLGTLTSPWIPTWAFTLHAIWRTFVSLLSSSTVLTIIHTSQVSPLFGSALTIGRIFRTKRRPTRPVSKCKSIISISLSFLPTIWASWTSTTWIACRPLSIVQITFHIVMRIQLFAKLVWASASPTWIGSAVT